MLNPLNIILLAGIISCFNLKAPTIGALSIGRGNGILPIQNSGNAFSPSDALNRIIYSHPMDSVDRSKVRLRSARYAQRNSFDDDLLAKNGLKLGDPNVLSLPLEVMINKFKYRIDKKIATGADATVYEGVMDDAPTKKLIFKVFTAGRRSVPRDDSIEAFKNEKIALSEVKRLIDFDNRNLIIITPKIIGKTLEETLLILSQQNQTPNVFKLIRKYLALASEFRKENGLVHNDINPQNVIVDENYNLHLIDFSKAVPLTKDHPHGVLEAFIDDSIALNSLGADMIYHYWNPKYQN